MSLSSQPAADPPERTAAAPSSPPSVWQALDLAEALDDVGDEALDGHDGLSPLEDDEAAEAFALGADPALTPAPSVLPDPDDAAWAVWVERIVRREEPALTALYDAASRRVHALVLRITQDTALTDEVVEDTFWQVWRQAPRFDASRGNVRTWLMAMARSRAIDALRRQARFRHEPWNAEEEDATMAAAHPAPQPPDLLDITREEHRLHQALRGLEAGPRQLVALAFFRGWTHEEIAQSTGQPLGTVKSQIRRALSLLKRRLMEPGSALEATSARAGRVRTGAAP